MRGRSSRPGRDTAHLNHGRDDERSPGGDRSSRLLDRSSRLLDQVKMSGLLEQKTVHLDLVKTWLNQVETAHLDLLKPG